MNQPGYVMLPWQDEPLFVESEYADGRMWVAVQKPRRTPVALISDFLELSPAQVFVEDVMLQREVIACGRTGDYRVHVYRKPGDTRLEQALTMLAMALFFFEQVKDIIDPYWRNRYTIRGDWAVR